MPASPANRPMRRTKTPLATLAALCALAVLALAPTPAAAVINNSGTSGCAAPHPGDQIYWNGGSWCAVQEGAGGTAATGTGAGSSTGAGSPGIFFWAQSDAPKDLPSTCSYKNAGACMPTQRGGREVQEAKDGPIAGTRGGGGSKAAGKSETARPKPKPASKATCVRLSNDLNTEENRAVLAYIKRIRSHNPDLTGNPFFRDPAMDKKVPEVDRKLLAWKNGQCKDQLPGGLPLGL